jgi:predicted transcriptional regulator
MSVTIELSDEVLARLEALAAARGVSVEEFAAQTLAQVPAVNDAFAAIVTDTISAHREILDRLAAT